jgi:MoxR-like ATPase
MSTTIPHARPANFQPESTYRRTSTCTALDEAITVARATGTRVISVSGPSGSSKTFAARHAAHRLGLPQYLVEISAATTAEDLIDRPWTDEDRRLVWVEQALVRAARTGGVVILDEFDLAPAKLLGRLHGLLDTHGSLRLSSGEELVPHKDFLVIACCNGLRRDVGGIYPVQTISSAFLGRSVFVAADYLSAADEIAIYKNAGYGEREAQIVYSSLESLRVLFHRGVLTIPPSIRVGLRVLAALANGVSSERAWRLVLLDGLDAKTASEVTRCIAAGSVGTPAEVANGA